MKGKDNVRCGEVFIIFLIYELIVFWKGIPEKFPWSRVKIKNGCPKKLGHPFPYVIFTL
jgi:hypothetical protein